MEALETLTTETPTDAPAPEQAKPLKLSEAVRLGAMATKQAFGKWGDSTETCAIGAAQVALGMPPGDGDHLSRLLSKAGAGELPCGHGLGGYLTVRDGIIHLNDKERWPREKIADWLEGLGL